MTVRFMESHALTGLSVTTTSGATVVFITPTEPPDDGTAGVREPRRPAPNPPALAVALDEDTVATTST